MRYSNNDVAMKFAFEFSFRMTLDIEDKGLVKGRFFAASFFFGGIGIRFAFVQGGVSRRIRSLTHIAYKKRLRVGSGVI